MLYIRTITHQVVVQNNLYVGPEWSVCSGYRLQA